MAVLPDADRANIAAEFNRAISDDRETCAALKDDIRQAINALDDFLNANATAVNNAIPLPARTRLTTAQKARCLMFVIRQRYLSGT